MNTWMCSFSFPVVLDCFLSFTGIRKDKEPYRAKVLYLFGTFRRDTQFWFRVSILFLTVFRNEPIGTLKVTGTARRFAVCVENSVPVASGAWHAQVWVKVLAR